jgi:hypothetical protein
MGATHRDQRSLPASNIFKFTIIATELAKMAAEKTRAQGVRRHYDDGTDQQEVAIAQMAHPGSSPSPGGMIGPLLVAQACMMRAARLSQTRQFYQKGRKNSTGRLASREPAFKMPRTRGETPNVEELLGLPTVTEAIKSYP